jgi:capsular polysaccharide export protein
MHVISSTVPIALVDNGKLLDRNDRDVAGWLAAVSSATGLPSEAAREPFLRIPPFPGARLDRFAARSSVPIDARDLIEEICSLRVGGTYWAAQPDLPADYVLVRSPAAVDAAREMAGGRRLVLWTVAGAGSRETGNIFAIEGECDPWHMLAGAGALVVAPDDDVALIAALLGVSTYVHDGRSGALTLQARGVEDMLVEAFRTSNFDNPFTGDQMTARDAIHLCGFWRQLIDSNRDIAGGFGFAFWKQDHVAPLLWNGSRPFKFVRVAEEVATGSPVAIWRAKAAPAVVVELERRGSPLIEVEDGFLRSHGLGADCIPPLSITVDRLGPYFDPSGPSELEGLIERKTFDDELIARATELRRLIVETGIGKYEQGGDTLERPAGERLHVLVPGQVEDDRAVQSGGCGLVANLDLLKRVRAQVPDAYILYKPHPDVVAGHRRGAIPDPMCLEYADEVCGEGQIASLIAMVDEVHVNTSLAGFEALLRGKSVTTYGVPFYAGWGLTSDLGPVPSRRTAKRTLDELVAAVLLVYPRYLDPVTGLPCPAEALVSRLAGAEVQNVSMLVGMRRLQGKVMRRLRSLVQ